jgi:hypothetical protein
VAAACADAVTVGPRPPWGWSAYSAARWAFSLLAGDAVGSAIGHLREGSRAKKDLERNELRAQAAVIRGIVEKLDNPGAVAYLIAYYLPKPELERQAGAQEPVFVDRFGEERKRHVHALAWWLLGQQGSGQHRIRGYQEIVSQYMGLMVTTTAGAGPRLGGKSLDRIRALLKMDMNQVGEKRHRCEDALKDLHTRAHTILDARLVELGIIDA